ncbi:hypothetical protein [Phenylobacterium sp.]|uniref:hypothetical protein n=1 Tax=Phenylobacterium sp. TaxID=1871053 RepID=UPI00286E28A4|nr:hypothetical protein [Phenylobacterium sp.]
MIADPIDKVEIRDDGRLFVKPATQSFSVIYRAAMEVGWNPASRSLFGPKPREWTYPMWFGQILAAAETEYGVRLSLTSQTSWVNFPDKLQAEIADPERWGGPKT